MKSGNTETGVQDGECERHSCEELF